MLGTLLNVISIILGSVFGILIKSSFSEKINKIIFQVMGLFTITLGISMAIKTSNFLLVAFSLFLGSLVGEALDLEKCLNMINKKLNSKVKNSGDKFSDGFITATLMYCIGPIAILGSIEEGLGNYPSILYTKSILDGVVSIALASALGVGVIFSIIPLFFYQGSITLFAGYLGNYLSEALIVELSAVGGILLLGLGINITEIKKFKVVNMLPSLLMILIINYLFV